MNDTPKHDDMQVRHATAAGLDAHKMQVAATVRTHAGREAPLVETRECSALASGAAKIQLPQNSNLEVFLFHRARLEAVPTDGIEPRLVPKARPADAQKRNNSAKARGVAGI